MNLEVENSRLGNSFRVASLKALKSHLSCKKGISFYKSTVFFSGIHPSRPVNILQDRWNFKALYCISGDWCIAHRAFTWHPVPEYWELMLNLLGLCKQLFLNEHRSVRFNGQLPTLFSFYVWMLHSEIDSANNERSRYKESSRLSCQEVESQLNTIFFVGDIQW